MANLQSVHTLIVGAGLSGLITAICLREKDPNMNILVVEANTFPSNDTDPIILDPISRNILHGIGAYKDYDFNEGQYRVFRLVNYDYGIQLDSEDTAILPYTNLIYTLYAIAVQNGVDVHLKSEVTSIDYQNKYVTLVGDMRVAYTNIVNATGSYANPKFQMIDWSSPIIDDDIPEYNISVNGKATHEGLRVLQPVTANYPSKGRDYIAVGDAGCYVDFFTYNSANLAIISGVTAADTIINNDPIQVYYDKMQSFRNHIIGSVAVRSIVPKDNMQFSIDLADVLIHGGMTYKDLYDKYKGTSG